MRPLTIRPHEARHLARHGRCTVIRAVEPQPAYPGIAKFSYETHPFAPSMFRGTPAEGLVVATESKAWVYEDWSGNIVGDVGECPLGPPGSETWCRETWQMSGLGFGKPASFAKLLDRAAFHYRADDDGRWKSYWGGWRPATQMPIEASRFPRVVHVGTRLCRLSGISNDECRDHGIDDWLCKFDGRAYDIAEKAAIRHTKRFDPSVTCVTLRGVLCAAWNRDNPRHPAESDPWVWVGQIERMTGE